MNIHPHLPLSRLPAIAAPLLLLATSLTTPAATLFGITFFGDELITIDSTTGETTGVTPLSEAVNGFDLATYNGRLYTYSGATNSVREIDPFTGTVTSSLSLTAGAQLGEGAFAIAGSGIGYLASANDPDFTLGGMNRLYSFDLTTGVATLIANTAFTLDALAVAPDGTLYGLGQAQQQLFRVDPLSGALTSIGELGLDQNSPFAALSFSQDGSTLFGVVDDRLYTIDPLTGAATAANALNVDLGIGISSVSGLTYAVPEPSAAALGLAGLLVLTRRRRKP